MVWTDVDMTYPNDEIPQLVKELDGYDQVVGARTHRAGHDEALRVSRRSGSIRKLASYLTATEIPDLNSGFRAFRRDVAAQYLHHAARRVLVRHHDDHVFLANGYSVKYVPIEYSRGPGESKFHPSRTRAATSPRSCGWSSRTTR